MGLRPCPSCQRHVRTGDDTCPFCHAALPRPTEALRRLALGGALMLSAAGTPDCAAVPPTSVITAASALPSTVPPYGLPPFSPAPSASTPVAQPLYGAMPSSGPAPFPSATASPSPTATPPVARPLYGAVAPQPASQLQDPEANP